MTDPDTLDLNFEAPYYARVVERIDHGKRGWGYLRVAIIDRVDHAQIGEYVRNYSTLFRTFYPFQLGGRWLALYSRHYTATRLMALPSCEDLGGEEPADAGFCPVDFYVPEPGMGFVAGCIWGDDSSWKVQFLDLQEADKGIVKRDDRFGHLELADGWSLERAVEVDQGRIRIAAATRHWFTRDGQQIRDPSAYPR
jgi:hypothetical protein